MARRHVNEFLRTTFANSGRIAGTGILYDDYSEESGGPIYGGKGVVIVRYPERNEEEKDKIQNTPVKTYKLSRYERIKYMTIDEIAEKVIKANITDKYCKSDCDSDDCPHELECCIRWLSET